MMEKLDKIKELPEFKDMSDYQIVKGLYENGYAPPETSLHDFAQGLGLEVVKGDATLGDDISSRIGSFGAGMADALTFGQDNKLIAAGNTLGDAVGSMIKGNAGMDFEWSKHYDANARRIAAYEESMKDQFPVSDIAGQIGGTVAAMSAGPVKKAGEFVASRLGAASNLGKEMAAGAVLGAADGSIRSAGEGNSIGDIATDTAIGGAFGASGGALGEGLMSAGKTVGELTKQVGRGLIDNADFAEKMVRGALSSKIAKFVGFQDDIGERIAARDSQFLEKAYKEGSVDFDKLKDMVALAFRQTTVTDDIVTTGERELRGHAWNALSTAMRGAKDADGNRIFNKTDADFLKSVLDLPAKALGRGDNKVVGGHDFAEMHAREIMDRLPEENLRDLGWRLTKRLMDDQVSSKQLRRELRDVAGVEKERLIPDSTDRGKLTRYKLYSEMKALEDDLIRGKTAGESPDIMKLKRLYALREAAKEPAMNPFKGGEGSLKSHHAQKLPDMELPLKKEQTPPSLRIYDLPDQPFKGATRLGNWWNKAQGGPARFAMDSFASLGGGIPLPIGGVSSIASNVAMEAGGRGFKALGYGISGLADPSTLKPVVKNAVTGMERNAKTIWGHLTAQPKETIAKIRFSDSALADKLSKAFDAGPVAYKALVFNLSQNPAHRELLENLGIIGERNE